MELAAMLNLLRKKNIMKKILWALAALTIAAFILFGADFVKKKIGRHDYVGTINGRKVKTGDFNKAVKGVQIQIFINYFAQVEVMDKLLKDKPLMNKLAWDRLLMLEDLKNHDITVRDEEVAGAVATHPLFSSKGVFDEKFYNYVLRHNLGLTAGVFEEEIRKSIKLSKLKDLILQNVSVSDEKVLDTYKKENEKAVISYIRIETEKFENTEKKANEVAAYINKTSFEKGASQFGLDIDKTDLITRFDYAEGVGEVYELFEILLKEKGPVVYKTRKGHVIARFDKFEPIDTAKFEKDKEEYKNKVLSVEKTKALSGWLAGLSQNATLVIPLDRL